MGYYQKAQNWLSVWKFKRTRNRKARQIRRDKRDCAHACDPFVWPNLRALWRIQLYLDYKYPTDENDQVDGYATAQFKRRRGYIHQASTEARAPATQARTDHQL